MSSSQESSIVIAVLTYKRPDDLAIILPQLLKQATTVDASVLVVDNCPDASAKSLVEGFSAPTIRYVNEPNPGISAARNRALTESSTTDFLAFIDDDETPMDGWLKSLMEQHQHDRPAAVTGPVLSEFEHEPSAWVKDSLYFERPRRPTGTLLPAAATSNLLLDLRQIRSMNLTFDERFGLSGGSDTLFTRQIVEQGGQIVWCNDAVVIDRVPAARLSPEWVLKRSLRSGNSWSRVSLVLASTMGHKLRTRMVLAANGAARMVAGFGRFLVGLVTFTVKYRASGLQTMARGIGMFTGAFGYVYSEYTRKGAVS